MVSAEEFAEWKEHPVTKEIFAELIKTKESIKDQIANGNTLGAAADDTHGLTHRAVGQLDGINQLLNISYAKQEDENDVNDQSGY